MNYERSEFKDLKYNVMDVDVSRDISNIAEYKDLKNIFIGISHNLPKGLSENKIIRFIVLAYDKNSPLVKKELVDVIERKKQAMYLSGYKVGDNGMFKEPILEVIAGEVEEVNHMALRYLKMQNNLDFMTMIHYIESHSQILSSLNKSSEEEEEDALAISDKKIKVIDKIAKVRDTIESLADKVFQKDVDLYNFVGSFELKEKNQYKITPEEWAS